MIRERPAQGHRRGLRRARPLQAVSEKVVAESRVGGNGFRLEKYFQVPPGGRHDIAPAYREIGAGLQLLGERVSGAYVGALAAHIEDLAGDAGNDGAVVAGIA